MAYINKEQVQEKRKQITAIGKAYGVTCTVSGANSSSITVTVRKGKLDFLGNHVETVKNNWLNPRQIIDNAEFYAREGYLSCNHYVLDKLFSGVCLEFLNKVLGVMKQGHYDNSDIVTDYFNVAWYMYIYIGECSKPYVLTE